MAVDGQYGNMVTWACRHRRRWYGGLTAAIVIKIYLVTCGGQIRLSKALPQAGMRIVDNHTGTFPVYVTSHLIGTAALGAEQSANGRGMMPPVMTVPRQRRVST